MKPITFSCEATVSHAPEGIASQILDLANWHDFTGFGFVPGIKKAEFELRTSEIVGSRIRVTRLTQMDRATSRRLSNGARLTGYNCGCKISRRRSHVWQRGSTRHGDSSGPMKQLK
jgi:hypothetical protein